jgi:DNA-binding LytR/AlgR family response regulator
MTTERVIFSESKTTNYVNKHSKVKIGIVEDEALIADHLAASLEDMGYEIVFIADNAHEAIAELENNPCDLMLVDINIHGEIDGIDLAHTLNRKFETPFIFVTSNTDKATIERVKFTEPAGFIIKPYTQKDLESNIEIALYKYHKSKNEDITEPESSFAVNDAFFVKDKHALYKIRFSDILTIEALDNYCTLCTRDKKYILSQTLKSVEEKVSVHGFMRVHRSYIVNLSHVEKILPKSVFAGNIEVPVSENHKNELMNRIKLL